MYINHNLMAANTARNLNTHYSNLAASTQRLSSGLRVNSAADDPAGLAIRELQRADIAALHQGSRNAMDAISMIQVADGALAIIDEKLIRMKELAEQAATGTYGSTQRLMIDSEFQAMAAEIDRIANATDFNGIKLLDGSLSGAHDGSGLEAKGAMKIHFGNGNQSAEDFYYIDIGRCTCAGLGLTFASNGSLPAGAQWLNNATIDWDANKVSFDIRGGVAGAANNPYAVPGIGSGVIGREPQAFDYYTLPVGLQNITATCVDGRGTFVHKPHIQIMTRDGTHLAGVNPTKRWANKFMGNQSWGMQDTVPDPEKVIIDKLIAGGVLNKDAVYKGDNVQYEAAQTSVSPNGTTVTINTTMNEVVGDLETLTIDKITDELVFLIGGCPNPGGGCNIYNLTIEAEMTPELQQRLRGGDVYKSLDGEMTDVTTQENAQKAIVAVTDAIISKDKIRAHLGAMQNRLENTVTNLTIQAENLQAAEFKISDVDVAIEMTNFIRNQILTQSAVAMLGHANSLPQMAMQLIRG